MTDDSTDASTLAGSTNEASLARAVARSAAIDADLHVNPTAYKVLTGDRPTGNLHLGHYFGTLANRVRLQNLGVPSLVLIADYQVIMDRDGTGPIRERVRGAIADYLASGIDPARTTIFAHSAIPELNQLMLPFLSLVTDSELRRNPTVKAEQEATAGRPLSGLLLTYPVHQAADILFCQANLVPVGKDQLPHLEQSRIIARRFDERYGRAVADHPVFPQPEALLSEAPTLLGTDGRKMSKSFNNAIEIGASADHTARAIKRAVTDSNRHITYEPATRPEVSSLVLLTALCLDRTPQEVAAEIGDGGAGTLKKMLTEAINSRFAAIRARRAELIADPAYLDQVLAAGNARAREIAVATLAATRVAMGMSY